MTRVNVYEAKTRFSELLNQVAVGETILVCRRNIPIAELRPVTEVQTRPRPLGLAAGTFAIPESFFEPLSEDLLDAFEG